MNIHAAKAPESEYSSGTHDVAQKHADNESSFQFVDHRDQSVAQRNVQVMANDSPRAEKTVRVQLMANKGDDSQPSPVQKKTNRTGLPDTLKSGIEQLSGHSMDDVKVHYNSGKPAQMQAHAYAQGRDIHLGPGQEKHLPHEAWHVVQQAQGRVRPTVQLRRGVLVNDDAGLEREADVMGAKAVQMKSFGERSAKVNASHESSGFSAGIQLIQAAGLFSTIWSTAKAVTGSLPGLLASGAALATGIVTGNPLLTYGGGAALAHGLYSTFYGGVEEDSPYVPQTLNPSDFEFTTTAADTVTKPLSTNDFPTLTGRTKDSGVEIGDVASYKVVQWLEKVGDGLTGDHQPSGAAIKEALRIQLHKAKTNVLTRTQLANAYARAVTIVMTDAWHKKFSRTYGGRNTKKKIQDDASDLSRAASKDWDKTYPELFNIGFSTSEVRSIENNFVSARKRFFKTGEPQSELLK